jgi:hypothetical protein
MNFKFACPHCGQHLSATSADSGRYAPCPTCTKGIWVPVIVAEPPPPVLDEKVQASRSISWMPTVLAASVCSVLSAGLAFFLANHNRNAPEQRGAYTGPSEQISANPSQKNTIAQLGLQSGRTPKSITDEQSPSRESGIWPVSTYPTEGTLPADGSFTDHPELDEKGKAVIAELSSLAAAQENPALAANASEKVEYLRKAFQIEARSKLPLYQDMRDAILDRDEYKFHRQANTVNAIAVFNGGTSHCTKDELFELATLLQAVMDAKTSFEQKEPIGKMQQLLDEAQMRQGLPAIGAISLQEPLK